MSGIEEESEKDGRGRGTLWQIKTGIAGIKRQ